MKKKLPKLPSLIERKIYKTSQTRGADDDEIYQNRVSRSSTVLLPYNQYLKIKQIKPKMDFENGYIVLIDPQTYFAEKKKEFEKIGLVLGNNMLIFFEKREDWNLYNPEKLKFSPAKKRIAPLGGEFVARIPALTAKENNKKILLGFNKTKLKGAGIRAYEYADNQTLKLTVIQLESIFWLCKDSIEVVVKYGMTKDNAEERKRCIIDIAQNNSLLNFDELIRSRILNNSRNTVCPLCLEELSSVGFFTKMEQAEGREVVDLTVTQLNLFHIEELRYGLFNHRPYNLGWGHHHCNTVVKDSGILKTIDWMKVVLKRNGLIISSK